MNEPSRVSTRTRSPISMYSGTRTLMPLSSVAGFKEPDAVAPYFVTIFHIVVDEREVVQQFNPGCSRDCLSWVATNLSACQQT